MRTLNFSIDLANLLRPTIDEDLGMLFIERYDSREPVEPIDFSITEGEP